ncbi:MAG: hypothetical protein IPL99_14495 [Candidatus Competibacteraceae bacterium]|nr:hypothetical protein [Candidatus Competibacteraceae bacterium]
MFVWITLTPANLIQRLLLIDQGLDHISGGRSRRRGIGHRLAGDGFRTLIQALYA